MGIEIMAADGGWALADLSALGGIGTLLVTIGGLFHLHGRQTKSAEVTAPEVEKVGLVADGAKKDAASVAKDLADYKVTAVEKFVPREHLDQMKAEIIQRIDKQDERLSQSFGQVTERLDRIIEGRPKA